ncbi:MAG: geranylgeranylglycerol-phosphate geranylgeranyltransferase [Flavobacteriales bacterium]|nr:MAG: geranylgeranylglycerol-phosphate geranylgeranyltransferase [Flavobacteriales bacterium]
MKDLIRLTRPLNLIIVALTMVVMRYGVIGGICKRDFARDYLPSSFTVNGVIYSPQVGFQLSLVMFVLLIISTVLIMAGGNVINDYFDTRIDRVNKPGAVLVGRSVKRRVAMATHWILSGSGLLLGVLVALLAHQKWLALIPPFAVGALWWYSTTAKRQLLLGNGLVATLSAIAVLQVSLYDLRMLEHGNEADSLFCIRSLWWWFLGYTAFAFISTLLRELQKDMADVRGDAANGCRTVPIAWGMKVARLLVAFWAMVIIVAVGLLADRVFTEVAARVYLYVLVIAPILASCILTWNARNRDQHNRAGNVMKLAMVFAVAFGAIYPWLIV